MATIDKDAKPWTLFEHVRKDLMKDCQDRGSPYEVAKQQLLHALRAAWADAGRDTAKWPLDGTHDSTATTAAKERLPDLVAAQAASQLVQRDEDQRQPAEHILDLVRRGRSAFVFVQGRAGCRKSTLANYTPPPP